MHRLAIFVDAGAPGIVPQASPIVLLLEAHHLGDFRLLLGRRLKGPKCREARGACADNGNACHVKSPISFSWLAAINPERCRDWSAGRHRISTASRSPPG